MRSDSVERGGTDGAATLLHDVPVNPTEFESRSEQFAPCRNAELFLNHPLARKRLPDGDACVVAETS